MDVSTTQTATQGSGELFLYTRGSIQFTRIQAEVSLKSPFEGCGRQRRGFSKSPLSMKTVFSIAQEQALPHS